MDPFFPRFESQRSPVLGRGGMVASSQPLATAAGLRVLARGGNAADAAVATAAALAVTEPCNTGLGGDCFALYYHAASGEVSALNGAGRSPRRLDLALLAERGLARQWPAGHPLTVTVPGACAGWCDLLERHGRLGREAVLAPAGELAEEGFPVGPNTAWLWDMGARTQLAGAPGGRALTLDGRAPRAGEIWRNPDLARVLERIAREGADAFYRGPVARAIAVQLSRCGGILDQEDLAEHRSSWVEPLSTRYRDWRIWECPPSGQGLTALLALNVLSQVDLAGLEPRGAERLHWQIEALRLAFADARRFVADPEHAEVPIEALLSVDYARERLRHLDPKQRTPILGPGDPLGASDTVYCCSVDVEGNACSFINSNYQAFGTGIVPEGCGFSLQNRGYGFSLEPGHPNAVAPGKRPYHTIIPGLATREEDGSLVGPFGVMGGFMQPQGHVQVVCAMVDDGDDPQRALDRPRFHLVDGTPDSALQIAPGFPEAILAGLRERGHEPEVVSGWARVQIGRGQIIRRDPKGVLWGGSDPRADGCAMPLV